MMFPGNPVSRGCHSTLLTLRVASPVGQVKNELTFPVEVLYQGDTKLEVCGVAEPDTYFSLPLNAVYALSSDLFFKPVGNRSVRSDFLFLYTPTPTLDCKLNKGENAMSLVVIPFLLVGLALR